MSAEVEQLMMFTPDEASRWVTDVNASLVELGDLITEGFERQAWKALGYDSWASMCDAEVSVPRLTVEQRRQLVGALRSEGLSTRAIGSAIGVAKATVDRDLASGGPFGPPEHSVDPRQPPVGVRLVQPGENQYGKPMQAPKPITGLDGKTYTSPPPRSEPKLSDEDIDLAKRIRAGDTIVLSYRTQRDLVDALDAAGLLTRIDRRTDWGNPFELPGDGDRDAVCDAYADHYLPNKPSLIDRLADLKGQGLACWCAPERCHGDALIEAMRGER